MMKRLQSGSGRLRDMQGQFQAVLKMGPLGNIMNQFPGMAGLDFHDSGVRIKKWMTMMDSMTDAGARRDVKEMPCRASSASPSGRATTRTRSSSCSSSSR